MILPIDADMNRGNQNGPLTVNVRDESLDLRARNSKLLQDVREICICNVAQDWEKAPEIIVDLQNLQVLVGEICSRNSIPKIEKTKIYDILLIEEVFQFH